MIKIMFVCLGNICRSPMAEFVMKDLVDQAHLSNQFDIASSATSGYNVRNGVGSFVHHRAKDQLERHHIDCSGKRAQVLRRQDYQH